MENELSLNQDTLKIDHFEILSRFIINCKQRSSQETTFKLLLYCSADIAAAVYYYRKYPDVNKFISECLKNSCDYLQLQWVRSTWARLSSMTEEEMSDLVINQILLVANSEEEQ